MKQSAIRIDSSLSIIPNWFPFVDRNCTAWTNSVAIDWTGIFNCKRKNWKVASSETMNEREKNRLWFTNTFGHWTENINWIVSQLKLVFLQLADDAISCSDLIKISMSYSSDKNDECHRGKRASQNWLLFYYFSNCSSKLIFITIFR